MRCYVLLAVDVVLFLIATILAFALRENFEFTPGSAEAFLPYLAATGLVSILFVAAAGLNRSIWRFSCLHDYLRVTGVVTGVCVGAVALSFAYNRLDGIARSMPFLQGIIGIMILVSARVLHRLRHSARKRKGSSAASCDVSGGFELSVLIVGVNRLTETYIQALEELGSRRIHVAGIVGRKDRDVGRLVASYPVLGLPEDIEHVLDSLEVHGVAIDRLVVTAPFGSLSEEMRGALLRIERSRGISLQLLTDVLALDGGSRGSAAKQGVSLARSEDRHRFEADAAEYEAFSLRKFWKLKRGLDATAALIILVLLSPAFVLVAALVATSIGFPVMFWQRRPGLGGSPFHLYKFRTMGAAYAPDGRRLSDEERVSRVGTFLRRTRLDELPQLINILRGDMSFIGPRPLLPRDQPKACAARLLVRPGLTGWAQVIGGRNICPEDKATLDVWYVRNASLLLDLKVAARTVPIILFGERISQSLIERARRELIEPGISKDKVAFGLEKRFQVVSSNYR